MDEILKQILSKVSAMEEGQQKLITRIDKIESDMATKAQQDENTQIIKAIRHNTETTNAEINALKLTTLSKEALEHLSTKEDVNKLNAKFEVLNSRLFHQEAELYELKAVK